MTESKLGVLLILSLSAEKNTRPVYPGTNMHGCGEKMKTKDGKLNKLKRAKEMIEKSLEAAAKKLKKDKMAG